MTTETPSNDLGAIRRAIPFCWSHKADRQPTGGYSAGFEYGLHGDRIRIAWAEDHGDAMRAAALLLQRAGWSPDKRINVEHISNRMEAIAALGLERVETLCGALVPEDALRFLDEVMQEPTESKRIHELKTWPRYFDAVADGRKTFEVRKDDRGYAVGDVLHLREWDPEPRVDVSTHETGTSTTCTSFSSAPQRPRGYTGRELQVEVTYIMRGPSPFGLATGFVVMGFRRLP